METDVRLHHEAVRNALIGLAILGMVNLASAGAAFASKLSDVDHVIAVASFELAAGHPALALAWLHDAPGEKAAWVKARALIETGQVEQARALLERQLEGQAHRGDAALMLGRMALQGGDTAAALSHFTTAAQLGYGETRQQALYELAVSRLNADDADGAGQILASMEPGFWSALGYTNLASFYSSKDPDAARPLVALRVALAMSEQDAMGERSASLRSQLLVRAGYLSYLQEDYEKAIGFIEQVPLDSYHTPRALHLHGLALAARGNHRAAMQSWHRAKKYPLAYPGVEDAWLGMGRGYDLAGYLGQAGEAYLAASASYESERVTLKKLAFRIRQEGAWKALIDDARHSDAQWFLADSRTLTQPRMAYLLRFIESPDAQQAVSRVSELTDLDAYLAEKQQHLEVFRTSLRTRLSADTAFASPGTAALDATAEELRTRILGLKPRIGLRADKADLANAAKTLKDVESSLASLGRRLSTRDARLAALAQRTDSALVKVSSLRSQTNDLRRQAESRLNDVALAFVENQDERMVFALDKTEQQIAHLYEYLALETFEREER